MKKNQMFYIVLAIVLVISILFFMMRHSKVDELTKEYANYVDMNGISYQSAQLPLFGSGVILYKVQLKDVPFSHAIDKMVLSVDGSIVKVVLSGVSFNVDEALRTLYGDSLPAILKTYTPYVSIWRQPLETLALSGVEEVKLNANFTIDTRGLSRQIKGEVQDKRLGKALFDFAVPHKSVIVSIPSMVAEEISYGTFSWEDVSLAKPYADYAKSIGYKTPQNPFTGIRIK